ncbi:trehalose-6-phosphate synthase [Rubrivirga marina]|uniref:Trehalose-6-phosphate synthase n=1 Tax=Rubrivirga marina TaxID=1196024 RepID=A0A271J6N6_9BACT|nr:trehalose-6-phosphate synthase [Rubrivirga marina]
MSLVLVANRAPIRPTPDGWAPSLGGLASALLPVLEDRGGAWVAMRGPDEETPLTQTYPPETAAFTVRRVPLEEPEFEAFYQGMANRVLWPLSHYLVEHVEPDRSFRDAYRAVNRRFAHAALDVARTDLAAGREQPTFWVQDYHMMLVPETIRAGLPDARIGFFWHVPWPASEVFRILPSARDLLRGMLASDLVGFHTEGYAENFRESARDLLGAKVEGETITFEGHRCRAESHPIGIDVERFEGLAMAPGAAEMAAEIREDLGGVQIVLGVDRLDYTKGLLLRMEAFERFLELYPERHGEVSLVQIATPSRTGVPAYDQLKREMDEASGRINGRYAKGAWAPVRYRYQSFDQAELAAYYQAADVAFVTPLRDGMNLVAHEFAAVSAVCAERGGRPGALVLSELTGAADYLDGAFLVNPYDADGLARTLDTALDLPETERRARLSQMREAVRDLDVHVWAQRFLESLDAEGED